MVATFRDDVSIYFARQQVNERLIEARKNLPPGADPKMGAISTGLGEVFMWTVNYAHPDGTDAEISDGMPGWQRDGSYLTPEGQRLTSSLEKAAYLRTVQDWIIRPQLKGLDGLAEVDAIGGFEKKYHVQPDPMKLFSYGLSFEDLIEALKQIISILGLDTSNTRVRHTLSEPTAGSEMKTRSLILLSLLGRVRPFTFMIWRPSP